MEEYTFWHTAETAGGLALANVASIAANPTQSKLATYLGTTAGSYSGTAKAQTSTLSGLLICAQSCGPFVYSRSASAPLIAWMQRTPVIANVYATLTGSASVWGWLLFATVLITRLVTRGNLIASMEQEIALLSAEDDHVAQLERKHRRKGGRGAESDKLM